MADTIEQLRAKTDEELITEHDRLAQRTSHGTGFYVEELDRRSRERATVAAHELAVASNRLARRAFWLSVATSVLSAVAAAAAILALLIRPAG